MSVRVARAMVTVAVCLMWLTACESMNRSANGPPSPASDTTASIPPPDSQRPPGGPSLANLDPADDVVAGKRQFREGNYGLAELHFRRAIEKGAGTRERRAEAWLGLAASYDRLRRFDLADRTYKEATAIVGPTAEILNNQGYSYLLRGNYRAARTTLNAARRLDPSNPYIQNNLDLLAQSERRPHGDVKK